MSSSNCPDKPSVVIWALDLYGTLIKVRLIDHREPLFLDATGTAKLERFALQYKGADTAP